MSQAPYNVLFVCTGNSARSIMAEAILNQAGQGRFRGFSAGSQPKGAVHPMTLRTLERMHVPTTGLRSKRWDEFASPGAPPLHFVFTVCDRAAGEACPVWPGQPMTAHWGMPDPAAVQGDEAAMDRAFRDAFITLKRRLDLFLGLPLTAIDRMALQSQVAAIGTH